MPMPNFRRGGDNPLPNMPAPAKPEPSSKPYTGRTNKFPAPCVNCGVRVEAEAGRLTNEDGKWVVSHIPPCPSMISEVVATTPVLQQTVIKGEVLYDGDYTIEDLPSGHRTFRLRTQAVDDDFMPGKQIIAVLNGPDNERDYLSFGTLSATGRLSVWKRQAERVTIIKDAEAFLADPHRPEVLKAIACYRCGHKLTVPASVHNGLGPECAKKAGF